MIEDMDQLQLRAHLKELRFCEGLTAATIARLAELSQPVEFSEGATLFREGEEHSSLYLISAGQVSLAMNFPVRGPVPLLTVGPGELLGWSPVLGGGRVMTATATALRPTLALAMPGEAVRSLSESDHEFGYHFARQLADALSRRLLATRLQLLDLFANTP